MGIFKFGFSQNHEQHDSNDRYPAVAGQFYPGDSSRLTKKLSELFAIAVPQKLQNVRAIIAPHAGYMYSGQIAASAFNQIDSDKTYKHIFIIGTSHIKTFNAASIYNSGNFITPSGTVKVDSVLANELIKNHSCFVVDDESQIPEHSLEVQLPFLQFKLKKNFSIVPIIVGTSSLSTIKEIAEALKPYFTSDNLFVISTDFSHYPDYKNACYIDDITARSIISNNPDSLFEMVSNKQRYGIPGLSTALCGWSSVLTLMYITENNALYTYNKVQYMNSGDISGDKSRVVGYWAIAVSSSDKDSGEIKEEQEYYSDQDKLAMLRIARNTITSYIINKKLPETDTSDFSPKLFEKRGVFVTLHKNGKLRGCIGRFTSDVPLYKVIRDMAIASSTQDSRFSPVTSDEINELEIEISILTPMKKIASTDEFELGRHGIYMNLSGRSGTFLPQVANETGWTKEEFLGYCARDKAGIGWDGWKKADLYVYEAIVFGEKDFK